MATIFMLSSKAAAFLIAMLPIVALAGETHCPSVLEGSKLKSVTVYDGPPCEHADLKPDTYKETKTGGRSEWDVAYIYKAGRKLYVECKYNSKTSKVLLEPDASTYKCEFLTQGKKGVSFSCKSR